MSKKQKVSNKSTNGSINKWIAGIDIGPRHMGLSVWKPEDVNVDPNKYIPYMEHSSLYVNGSGEGYWKWQESISEEMVYNWVHDRWIDIFLKCEFVVIEKQMINATAAKKIIQLGKKDPIKAEISLQKMLKQNRMCLCIEQILKTIFRCYIPFGGPQYIVKGPTWWKNATEVLCTGKHKNNKQTSVKKFETIFGKKELNKLKSKWIQTGKKTVKIDDMIDAQWIVRAAYLKRDELLKDIAKTLNHDFYYEQITIRIPPAERKRPILPLNVLKDQKLNLQEREKFYLQKSKEYHIKKNSKK